MNLVYKLLSILLSSFLGAAIGIICAYMFSSLFPKIILLLAGDNGGWNSLGSAIVTMAIALVLGIIGLVVGGYLGFLIISKESGS